MTTTVQMPEMICDDGTMAVDHDPKVQLVAILYEWTCPKCDTQNVEVEVVEAVTCSHCEVTFEVGDFVHTIGAMRK